LVRITDVLLAHDQADSIRTGCSTMLHFLHLPGLSSTTSSSPGMVQTYDTGIFCRVDGADFAV
jgi:hypothetical protein